MGTVGWTTHRGARLYLADFEGLNPAEVAAVVERIAAEVRAEPAGSVVSVTHVKGLPIDMAMVDRLRHLANGNRPHVRVAALAGLSPAQRFVFNAARALAGREFHVFATLAEALDFAAAQR